MPREWFIYEFNVQFLHTRNRMSHKLLLKKKSALRTSINFPEPKMKRVQIFNIPKYLHSPCKKKLGKIMVTLKLNSSRSEKVSQLNLPTGMNRFDYLKTKGD